MYWVSMVIIMWDPEYCDSQVIAVEASGESRDELCTLHRQTQLKINRRLTRGACVTSAWQWSSDAMDKKCFRDYPFYARLHPDLRCLAEFLFVAVLSIQLGTSF